MSRLYLTERTGRSGNSHNLQIQKNTHCGNTKREQTFEKHKIYRIRTFLSEISITPRWTR